MINNYEYLLFKRFFLSRKNEGYISIISWFSLIGISLGVAVLIIVMSVMNGFRDELINRIVGINGHINIFSTSSIITNNEINLFKNFDDFKDKKIHPIIETQGLIISDERSKGVIIRSLASSNLMNLKNFSSNFRYGNIYQDNSNEIIIGENLARYLKVKVGDKIKIAIPKSDNTIFGNIPRFKTIVIKGIFNIGMYEFDSNFIFTPLNIGQNLLILNDNEYSSLEIFIKNPELSKQFMSLLNNFIIDNKLDHLYISTWQDRHRSFLEALKIERNVMFLILILIILVASMNIISGLVLFVKDKNKEIGILRTLGVSQSSLMKIFILIGSTIGILGISSGTFLGIIFCRNIKKIQNLLESFLNVNLFSPEIYYLSNLPARINYYEVIFIIIISLFLTIIATIYPAIKSSRINPINVIRNG